MTSTTTPVLDEQLTLRLTGDQRQYVRDQLQALRSDPQLGHLRWSEGDIVRTLIEDARKNGRKVAFDMEEHQ